MKLLRWILKKTGLNKYVNKMMKPLLFKKIYPRYYKKRAKKPMNEKKVVFIEVRFDEVTDNFKLIYERLEAMGYEISVCYLRNIVPGRKAYIKRCLNMLAEIADAHYVFLNDACDVTSCIDMRKETVLTQVWHGCGAFKKFGMSTAEKIFGADRETLEKYPNYRNLDYVTVSSPEVVWAYEEAMNFKHEDHIVRPVGVSRTDIFYDDGFKRRAADKLKEVFPQSEGKKVILYAPTFRGRVKKAASPRRLDIGYLKALLGDDYVLVIKHHPFVKKPLVVPEEHADFALDVTKLMEIDELLCVSDICISDYSSLVFEYALFEKPMLFFAYDLENYFDWRGFYYEYEELAPGPVVTTNKEIVSYIRQYEKHFDSTRVHQFKEKFMSACDGHATDKILKMIGITE